MRGAPWRRQLKYLASAMLMVLAVMLVSGLTVAALTGCAHVEERCGVTADGDEYCAMETPLCPVHVERRKRHFLAGVAMRRVVGQFVRHRVQPV